MRNTDYDYPEIMDLLNKIECMDVTHAIYKLPFEGIKISTMETPGGKQFAIHNIDFRGRQSSGFYLGSNKDDAYLEVCIRLEKYLKCKQRDYNPLKWEEYFSSYKS